MGYITRLQGHKSMHKEMIPKGALEVKQILERQLNRESSLDRRNQPTIPTEK